MRDTDRTLGFLAAWAPVFSVLPSQMVRSRSWLSTTLCENYPYLFTFTGVYYYCYEAVKTVFEKAKGKGKPMSTSESMLAGAIAGSAVVMATHPIWTVNVCCCCCWNVNRNYQVDFYWLIYSYIRLVSLLRRVLRVNQRRPMPLLLAWASSRTKVLLACTLASWPHWCWSSTPSSNTLYLSRSRTRSQRWRPSATLTSSCWALLASFAPPVSPILTCKLLLPKIITVQKDTLTRMLSTALSSPVCRLAKRPKNDTALSGMVSPRSLPTKALVVSTRVSAPRLFRVFWLLPSSSWPRRCFLTGPFGCSSSQVHERLALPAKLNFWIDDKNIQWLLRCRRKNMYIHPF